jgi:Zn finger protein HypA/HybF involved in hydrogenase expression
MKNNRLGCLTGAGILSAFATLFVLAGVAFASGGHMFSSGDLNSQPGESIGGVTSHAQISKCKTCHTALWERETMADRCVACHTAIAEQMMSVAKLHGAISHKDPTLACRDCHFEHRGATASLTDLGNNVFPHEALGYALTGHQFTAEKEAFACSDCHTEDVTIFASDSCRACHSQMDIAFAQAHTLSFGTDCLVCHDGVDRYGSDFNHDAFAFQLIGEHAEAGCTNCHLDARAVVDLQSTPQDCYSCHRQNDPHGGAYGNECGVCHSSQGWEPAKFDHNLSVFKLEGEHAEAACDDCHKNDVFKGTPADCYSCHGGDDEHNGRFGTNCAACHTLSDWDDASADHNLFVFKLEGKHAGVECESCHVNGVFQGTPTDCYACHQQDDEHNGQFGTQCSACHTPNDWEGVSFDHNLGSFPLTGAHVSVACDRCHVNNIFAGTPSACVACHADPGFHAGAFGSNCASCHLVSSWSPAGFNMQHSEPQVDEGGSGIYHGGATCRECHPSTVREATCIACHEGGFEDGDDD